MIGKKIILPFAALFIMNSCDEPVYPDPTGEKGVLVMEGMELSVNEEPDADVGSYVINIKLRGSGDVVESWMFDDIPAEVKLPVGKYIVEAYNEELQPAAWNAPYYYASSEIEVQKDADATIRSLNCVLSNVKIDVAYSDELKAAMGNDAVVDVSMSGVTLQYGYNEDRSGYFMCPEGACTLVATFTGTVNGMAWHDYQVLSDVKAGQARVLTFELTDNLTLSQENIHAKAGATSQMITVSATGAWEVSVSDDASTWISIDNKKESSFVVNIAENESTQARTGTVVVKMGSLSRQISVSQEGREIFGAPRFESSTVDITGENDAADFGTGKQDAVVNIIAENGIASLKVTIDSEILSGLLPEVGLEESFDLATGQGVNGTDLTAALVSLGFPVAEGGTIDINGSPVEYKPVVNETNVQFDVTTFIPLLSLFGQGSHNFIVEVTDNADLTSSVTLHFVSH